MTDEDQFKVYDPENDEYYQRFLEPLEVPRQSYNKVEQYEKRLRNDIAFFADFYFDLFLEPKQIEFANSCINNDHTAACFSRQTGKSTMLSILNVHQLLYGKNTFIEFYAPTEKQALKVVFARTKQLFESQDVLYDEIKKIMRSGWIEMYNKNCMQAQTANRDSNIRGFSPSVIAIDESQDIPDDKYQADIKGSGAAMKGLSATVRRLINRLPVSDREMALKEHVTTTRIWECGTPRGRNHFYENIEMPGMHCYVVKQPWHECSFIDKAWIQRERVRMPESLFLQEYECVFGIDEGFAFDWNDITAAMDGNKKRKFTRVPEMMYVGGIDIGQKVDYTVLTILEVMGTSKRMVFHYVWPLNMRFMDMTSQIAHHLDQWNPSLVVADVTGYGKRIYHRYFVPMDHPIKGLRYNAERKTELVNMTKTALERGELELWDDLRLKKEFKTMPEKRLDSGQFKYQNQEEHDDQVNAVMLAVFAAEALTNHGVPKTMKFYDPVKDGGDMERSWQSELGISMGSSRTPDWMGYEDRRKKKEHGSMWDQDWESIMYDHFG